MRTAIVISYLAAVVCGGPSAFAQATQGGPEFDVLPYATGGWYGSAWWGHGHMRVRAVASDVNLPDVAIAGDFEEGESRAYAGLVDYFPRSHFVGPWIGAGIEHWKNRIRHPAETQRGEYTNWMFTVGGGWVINLGRYLYLNPWAAGHVRIAGDERTRVGSRTYEPPRGLGEASIKIGLRF